MVHTAKSWKVVLVGFGVEIIEDGVPIAIMCASALYDEYQYADLIAAAPDLLALVEQVEWIDTDGAGCSAFFRCPWCHGWKDGHGHRVDCPRQAALAKVYGNTKSEV